MPEQSSAPASRRSAVARCITRRPTWHPRRRYGPAPLIRCQTEESADRWEEKLEKIWLKSYPPGVPAEIDINQYASLREVLEDSCAKFGSRPAYSCMEDSSGNTALRCTCGRGQAQARAGSDRT